MRNLPLKNPIIRRIAATGILMAAFSLSYWSLERLNLVQENKGAEINVSGRQRMLSQRIALLAAMISYDGGQASSDKLYDDYLGAIMDMERAHHGLISGDERRGLLGNPSEGLRRLYFGPKAYVDRDVKEFIKAARELPRKEALDRQGRLQKEIALNLSTMAGGDLLASLDAAVHQYEQEGAQTIAAFRLKAIAAISLAGLAAVALAMIMFKTLIKGASRGIILFKGSSQGRRNVLMLALVMGIIAAVIGPATIAVFYNTAFEEWRLRLIDLAQSQARLIEAAVRYDQRQNKNPLESAAAIISQLKDAREHFKGFGKTGELMMARRDGDQIAFIMRPRNHEKGDVETISFRSNLAEPMRRALSWQSGTIIGLDYRGIKVLAAHEPVAVLDLGIVAKIDLSEVRMPYVKASAVIAFVAIAGIALGAIVFFRISNPMVMKLAENETRLAETQRLAHVGSWQWEIGSSRHFWSGETYRILGVPLEAPPTQEIFEDTIHPDDRERVFEAMADCLLNHASKKIEYRILRPDGETRHVQDVVETTGDPAKAVNYVIGTIQDITERKLAEKEVERLNEELEDRVKRRTRQLTIAIEKQTQMALDLQYSEELHRGIFANAMTGIVLTDGDDRFVQFNDAWTRMLGYEPDELRAMTCLDIIHPFDAGECKEHLRRLKNGEITSFRLEGRYIRKDGSIFWGDVSVSPVKKRGGQASLNIGVIQNITLRKEAEAELRKLSRAVEQSPVAIVITNTNAIIEYVNHGFSAASGYPPEEVIGKKADILKSGLMPEEAYKELWETIASGKTWRGELLNKKKNGELYWDQALISPIAGADGKITHYLGIQRDVTADKQREQDLRDSEKRLASAQRMAKLGNWDWTMSKDEIIWSDETFRIFGLRPRQFKVTYEAFENFIHPDDRKAVRQAADESIASGKEYGIDHRIVLRDKTVKHVHGQGEVKLNQHGRPDGISGTIQDITERIQREEEKAVLEEELRQSRKMESLGQLAGGIAHEFNNMLVPIIGITEMTIEGLPKDSQMRENLGVVMDAADKARRLIQQILAYSRIDGVEMTPVDITDVFQKSLKLLQATIPSTIKIEADILTSDGRVMASSTEIHQAIMNLGVNAAHAIGKEHGTIWLKIEDIRLEENDALCAQNLQPGSYMKMTVKDNGCGMDKETMDRIFEPFFTTKGVGEGTGMGLPMVLGCVKRMGGAITVESEKGKGTAFNIYLPLMEDKEKPLV